MFVDRMVTMRGSDLVFWSVFSQCVLSLCILFLYHFGACACTEIWISLGTDKGVTQSCLSPVVISLMLNGFCTFNSNCSVLFVRYVIGSYKTSEFFLSWSSLVCLSIEIFFSTGFVLVPSSSVKFSSLVI